MDDIAEQNDIANEISNAVSSAVGFGQDIDEDELEKELEELEQEELDKELLGVQPETDELPEVPSTDLPAKAKEKEKKKGTQGLLTVNLLAFGEMTVVLVIVHPVYCNLDHVLQSGGGNY